MTLPRKPQPREDQCPRPGPWSRCPPIDLNHRHAPRPYPKATPPRHCEPRFIEPWQPQTLQCCIRQNARPRPDSWSRRPPQLTPTARMPRDRIARSLPPVIARPVKQAAAISNASVGRSARRPPHPDHLLSQTQNLYAPAEAGRRHRPTHPPLEAG